MLGLLFLREYAKLSVPTGKSLSEALIFASTNSQHDDRLFIQLQVQYMFSPCSAKIRASDKDLPVSLPDLSYSVNFSRQK